MRFINCIIVGLLTIASVHAATTDWPQWRGPTFQGSSEARDLPDRLDPASNQLWATPLPGPGSGTPVVAQGRIFLNAANKTTGECLALCVNLADGKLLWQKVVSKAKDAKNAAEATHPSPVTDGQRVWFLFGTGDMAAFDAAGKPLWTRTIFRDHGDSPNKFGYASSPLLFRDRLYIQALHGGQGASYVLALDPTTGKDLFRIERPTEAVDESRDSYTTPIPGPTADKSELVIFGADLLTLYDADSGKEKWRVTLNPKRSPVWRIIPTPVCSNGLVLCADARGGHWRAIRNGGTGDVTQTMQAWDSKPATDTPSPAVYKGSLYFVNFPKSALIRLDVASGTKKGELALSGEIFPSPIAADGKIFCLTTAGIASVIDAESLTLLNQTDLGEGKMNSSVVPVDGHVLVRTAKNLRCFIKK